MGVVSIMFLLGLAWLVLLIWALAEMLTTPEAAWQAADLNQWLWVGVTVFLPLIGVVLYVGVARSRLKAASAGNPAESAMVR